MAGRNLFAQDQAPKGRNLFAESPSPQQRQIAWSDVPKQAVSNLGPSAVKFVGDIYQAVRHPIDTLEAVSNVGAGALQNVLPESFVNTVDRIGEFLSEKGVLAPNNPKQKEMASQVGQFFVDRYGTEEGFKNALATDPVGVMADVSTILTAGGTLAARAPGTAGQLARAAGTAGRAIDPLAIAGKGAKFAASGAGKAAVPVLGVLTGAGSAPIEEAARAGRAGGASAQAFTKNLRGGSVEAMGILDDAKSGLNSMRQARSNAYRSGMADISKDKTILDFNDISAALKDTVDANTFNGVPKSRGASKALDDVAAEIDSWAKMDPAIYHTPEGLDALKQRVGDLVDWTNKSKSENMAAQTMYNKIKGVIEKQAPEYSRIMKDYAEGSEQIKNIEKALSLGDKASADTALRKLTSVMRDNVVTNYGERGRLAEQLQTASGSPLMPSIAGQAMSSPVPRGLSQLGTHAAITGAAGAALSPWALATIPFQSPRLVGEASYYGGRATGAASDVGRLTADLLGRVQMTPRGLAAGAYQGGRLSRELEDRNK